LQAMIASPATPPTSSIFLPFGAANTAHKWINRRGAKNKKPEIKKIVDAPPEGEGRVVRDSLEGLGAVKLSDEAMFKRVSAEQQRCLP
jgi:hypothetical protein